MKKDFIYFNLPTKENIQDAHQRILDKVHRTPLLSSARINELVSAELFFKCENMQKAGAFKSRGAVNALFSLKKSELRNGVCTHSSGNHAQALARAAQLAGVPAYIVMPENAPHVKVDAVKAYGGKITFCEATLEAREQTLSEVKAKTKAKEIHPYDNLKIIEGQATCAKEIYEEEPNLDFILAPVGGGGLLSGTALATHYWSPQTQVYATEPEGAADAYASFNSRAFVPSIHPKTMADGLLTSLGDYTFPIMLKFVDNVLLVSEKEIVEALKIIMQYLKIVVEPSSAVPLAAILKNKEVFEGKRISIILSGGNVDMQNLVKLLSL